MASSKIFFGNLSCLIIQGFHIEIEGYDIWIDKIHLSFVPVILLQICLTVIILKICLLVINL